MSKKRKIKEALVDVSDSEEESIEPVPLKKKRTNVFAKDLKLMMYGFGDVRNPVPESVELVEDIVMEFISEMTKKAKTVEFKPGSIKTQDLVFLIRRDAKKLDRVRELIRLKSVIEAAKKMASGPGPR